MSLPKSAVIVRQKDTVNFLIEIKYVNLASPYILHPNSFAMNIWPSKYFVRLSLSINRGFGFSAFLSVTMMSQKFSLMDTPQSVSRALMSDIPSSHLTNDGHNNVYAKKGLSFKLN